MELQILEIPECRPLASFSISPSLKLHVQKQIAVGKVHKTDAVPAPYPEAATPAPTQCNFRARGPNRAEARRAVTASETVGDAVV